jgi:cytochrome c
MYASPESASPKTTPSLSASARAAVSVALVAMLASVNPGSVHAQGDAVRGEAVYQGCMDCHSLDKNDVGPKHRGVFGRKAASVPDYNYSSALRKSGITWDEDTLDKWLTSPQDFVPGVKMFYRVVKAQDRADVIAYLKKQGGE